MTKWKVSYPGCSYITVAETAEEAKEIAIERNPWFSNPGIELTVERCPDKVYLVYAHTPEKPADVLLKVCSTEEAAERYISSVVYEEYRKDCYIEEEEVFE